MRGSWLSEAVRATGNAGPGTAPVKGVPRGKWPVFSFSPSKFQPEPEVDVASMGLLKTLLHPY